MSEAVATDESFLQGLVRAPSQMDFIEAVETGVIDGVLSVALLTHEAADTAGKVVEYALMKPTGLTLAVFSALCIKSAAGQIVRAVKNS